MDCQNIEILEEFMEKQLKANTNKTLPNGQYHYTFNDGLIVDTYGKRDDPNESKGKFVIKGKNIKGEIAKKIIQMNESLSG